MSALRKNYFFSLITTMTSLLFPMITFPYVSRTLGPAGMGMNSFAIALVTYFVTVSTIGINIYGQRCIAGASCDRKRMAKLFGELTTIHAISSVLLSCVYVATIYCFDRFSGARVFYLVAGVILFVNVFSLDWFFKGVEDFKYITVRTFIIRLLLLISIFLLVKNESDAMVYLSLVVASTCGPYIFNVIRARGLLGSVRYGVQFNVAKVHLKQMGMSSAYLLLTNLYSNFPIVYLGFVAGDTITGYLTAAQKIYLIVLSLFSSLTIIMFPKMSALIASGDDEHFHNLIKKSFDLVVPVSIFATIFVFGLSDGIMIIVGGGKFAESISVLMCLSPLIFVVAISQIYISQILLPMGLEKLIVGRTSIAVVVGVSLSVLLSQLDVLHGTAISIVVSESLMAFLLSRLVMGVKQVRTPWNMILKNFLAAIPVLVFFLLIPTVVNSTVIVLMISLLIGIVYFFIMQIFVLNNDVVIQNGALYSRRMFMLLRKAFG